MKHLCLFPAWTVQCVYLLLTVQLCAASVTPTDLPRKLQDCYNNYRNVSLKDEVGEMVCWSCESSFVGTPQASGLDKFQGFAAKVYAKHVMDRVGNLLHNRRHKRQATSVCRRREYRTLSDAERNRFHRAINALKEDQNVIPNRYDVLALIHRGPEMDSAHGGPNFLGWHRLYLLAVEMELQEVDPEVCLPYWDSSLDNELRNPRMSYVFSPAFLGTFDGWQTPNGTLRRTIGSRGQLISDTDFRNVMSQRRTADITRFSADPANNLESHHDGVHVFVGGHMGRIPTAAFDPAFFLHHCYIDYIWERFRIRQRALGINPELDYPSNPPRNHEPNRRTGFGPTAFEAYSANFTRTYEYEPSPTCSWANPSCGTPYLECNVQRNRCFPIDPTGSAFSSDASPEEPPRPIQNSFCVDGVCDSREWVYVPVKVVSLRPPDFGTYESYPVYNGSIHKGQDIYQPPTLGDVGTYFSNEAPKKYDKCKDRNGMGQVYIQSQGVSYDGFYREGVLIDQRMPTSLAMGYLAVKDPKMSRVTVLFRAFDSCGRICRTVCKIPGTNDYDHCSGAFDLEDTPGRPNQYSRTFGQATLNTWTYKRNQQCPTFHDDDVVLTFYCDYSLKLPWLSAMLPMNVGLRQTLGLRQIARSSKTEGLSQTGPGKRERWSRTIGSSVGEASNLVVALNDAKTSSQAGTSVSTSFGECRIDAECTIDVPCSYKKFCVWNRYQCRGLCDKYVECSFGRFRKKTCPKNWIYDEQIYNCKKQK